MTAPSQSYANNALTLGKGTLASRLLGFVRDAAIAALLGGGWMADALLLAFRLPNFARALLANGAFAYALVPAYRSLKNISHERAEVFVRSMTLALFLFFSVVVILGAVFSDKVALILAPGFGTMPDVLAMASAFMALSLLSLPLVSGAAVSSAALMAEGRFRPPAYASAVFNIVVIVSAGLAFLLDGPGGDLVPYVLCFGIIAAGLTQWFYQVFFLRRLGFPAHGPLAFRDPLFTQALRALPRSVFSVGGHQANLLAATLLTSFFAEGSISALYFAERMIDFPLGVIGASMGLAALSDLSALAPALGDGTEPTPAKKLFTDRLTRANTITLFFALPAAVGTACLAVPLTASIFGYGEFDQEALARTSDALFAYLVGLPALALIRPLLAGLSALGKTAASTQAALAGLIGTILFGCLFLPTGAAWGPALAVSLAAWTNAAFLLRSLARQGYFPVPNVFWPLKSLLACAVMALCVILAADMFATNLGKVATIPLGVAVYLLAARLLRMEESSLVLKFAWNAMWEKGKKS